MTAERLQSLEQVVYGISEKNDTNLPDKNVSEALLQCKNSIESISDPSSQRSRPKIAKILKKGDVIRNYLDLSFSDEYAMDPGLQRCVVAQALPDIEKMSEYLRELESLKNVLDSEHIKHTSAHVGKLKQLNSRSITQEAEARDFDEKVHAAITAYNEALSRIDRQLLLWNKIISELENSKSN